MDNCYNIKDIFNDMFIDIVDIKYFWIFHIVNLIGLIICWVISYNNEEKIVPILITIFFIASIISDFTDDIYFYTVNGVCLLFIVVYIIYVYKNKKEIMIADYDDRGRIYFNKIKKNLKTNTENVKRDNDTETDTSRFYNLSDSRSNSNRWLYD
jgi:Ca2+/Na+ antiporter